MAAVLHDAEAQQDGDGAEVGDQQVEEARAAELGLGGSSKARECHEGEEESAQRAQRKQSAAGEPDASRAQQGTQPDQAPHRKQRRVGGEAASRSVLSQLLLGRRLGL